MGSSMQYRILAAENLTGGAVLADVPEAVKASEGQAGCHLWRPRAAAV